MIKTIVTAALAIWGYIKLTDTWNGFAVTDKVSAKIRNWGQLRLYTDSLQVNIDLDIISNLPMDAPINKADIVVSLLHSNGNKQKLMQTIPNSPLPEIVSNSTTPITVPVQIPFNKEAFTGTGINTQLLIETSLKVSDIELPTIRTTYSLSEILSSVITNFLS